MVSFSKSLAVIASLTTIAVGAVAAVRYFDGMDGQIKDQRLLIEKLQKDLKGRENGAQSPQSQPPATPSLPAPPTESLQDPPPCLLHKSQTRQNLRRPRSEDNVWLALMHIYAIIKPCAYWSFLVFR